MDSSEFAESVYRVLEQLPPGMVMTYGELATEAGFSGAARAVGTLLARGIDGVPWWRVVTSTGRLVPGHEKEHARRLREEGVVLKNNRVAMSEIRLPGTSDLNLKG